MVGSHITLQPNSTGSPRRRPVLTVPLEQFRTFFNATVATIASFVACVAHAHVQAAAAPGGARAAVALAGTGAREHRGDSGSSRDLTTDPAAVECVVERVQHSAYAKPLVDAKKRFDEGAPSAIQGEGAKARMKRLALDAAFLAGSGWDLRAARAAMGYDPVLGTPPALRADLGGQEAARCWSRMRLAHTQWPGME